MNYDYASEILGTKTAPAGKTVGDARHDYAADLLAPKGVPQGKPTAFDRLPLQNRDSTTGTASFVALSKAAMVDDPATKARIIAQDLFPNDKNVMDRFGMVDGELVYVKDDKLYRAAPGGILGGAKGFAANMAGNALPIAGGTAGAVMGAAGGPASAAAGATLGAMAGKAANVAAANLVFDEPQDWLSNLGNIAKEGAFSLGGSVGGSAFTKWVERNTLRDAGRMNMNAVKALDAKAADVGGTGVRVDLNVAQRTGVPSLMGRVEAIGRMPGAAADDVQAGLARTNAQAAEAGQSFINQYSGRSTSLRSAGESARTGANAILDRIAKDRSTAAKPLYEQALKAQVQPSEELIALAETPAFKAAFKRGQQIAANEGIDLMDGQNSMLALHYAKLGLDAMLDPKAMMKEGVSSVEQRAIVGVKERLLRVMDKASPEYARARSVYGHFMPTLKASREGLIGDIANLADDDLNRAARLVFSPQTAPEDVAKMRSMFFRYDQGEKWKDLVTGYLQDTFNAAGKEFKSGNATGQAPTWRYMMFGDKRQRANLQAAMTREQFSAFGDMMDVFEAVNRTKGAGNSITMPMQEQRRELGKGAASSVANALRPRQALIDWLDQAALGKHLDTQVEILFSPNGIQRLKELKKMDPRTKEFVQGFSTLFGVSASPEGAAATDR